MAVSKKDKQRLAEMIANAGLGFLSPFHLTALDGYAEKGRELDFVKTTHCLAMYPGQNGKGNIALIRLRPVAISTKALAHKVKTYALDGEPPEEPELFLARTFEQSGKISSWLDARTYKLAVRLVQKDRANHGLPIAFISFGYADFAQGRRQSACFWYPRGMAMHVHRLFGIFVSAVEDQLL